MQTLGTFEDTFGKLINSEKSPIMVHKNVFYTTKERTNRITGFKQRQRITNYLGYPLFVDSPMNSYFSDIISNVICRITGWETKQLNYGGRVLSIKNFIHTH